MRQIAEGIVRGDDHAPVCRDLGDRRTYLGIERLERFGISRCLSSIFCAAWPIRRTERVGNVFHIDLCIWDRLEGVRIGRIMIMMPMGATILMGGVIEVLVIVVFYCTSVSLK